MVETHHNDSNLFYWIIWQFRIHFGMSYIPSSAFTTNLISCVLTIFITNCKTNKRTNKFSIFCQLITTWNILFSLIAFPLESCYWQCKQTYRRDLIKYCQKLSARNICNCVVVWVSRKLCCIVVTPIQYPFTLPVTGFQWDSNHRKQEFSCKMIRILFS